MTGVNQEGRKAKTEEKVNNKKEIKIQKNKRRMNHHRRDWLNTLQFSTELWPISSLQPSISSCSVSSRFSFRHCSAWICSFRNRISAFSFSSMWSADVRNDTMSSRSPSTSVCSSWRGRETQDESGSVMVNLQPRDASRPNDETEACLKVWLCSSSTVFTN